MDKSISMKFLLSVINPGSPDHKELAKTDNLAASIKLARINGLYYLFLCRLKELDIDIPSSEEKKWSQELDNLAKYKKTIELIDRLSTKYGIDYILIKDCNTVPHIPRDIDTFVRSEDRTRFINALEDIGMRCTQSGIAETSLTGEYLKTDIYTDICYMGVDFLDKSILWNSRVENRMFGMRYIGLNNESNFILLLIHSLFGHRSMSLLDFLHLTNIYDKTDINFCRDYAISMGWGRTFDTALTKFNEVRRDLNESKFVYFPYLFNKDLLLDCLSGVEGFDNSLINKFFVNVTFVQDRLIYELKDSKINNVIKSSGPLRNVINSVTASIKSRRGDRKSLNTQKER